MSPVPRSEGATGAGWVRRRADRAEGHRCSPPTDDGRPAGAPGDLWRCTCGRLWEIRLGRPVLQPGPEGGPDVYPTRCPTWAPPTLWNWWRYGGRPAAPPEPTKPPRPPLGPAGVSPGPDGSR